MKRASTVFSVALTLMIVAVAHASLPPQIRPTDPSPFLGEWRGHWVGDRSGGGILWTSIDPPDSNGRVMINTALSNAVVPSFSIPTRLVDGELVLESPTLDMVFRLHEDQLIAKYNNKRINASGTWYLKRKN